jgi:hypothetical protein
MFIGTFLTVSPAVRHLFNALVDLVKAILGHRDDEFSDA